MSKKRALLTSAVLSMAVLAASCGGGGGGTTNGTQNQTNQTNDTGGGTGNQTNQTNQTTLGTPAVFVRLAGANLDGYFLVDKDGNKVQVQGLENQNVQQVLYQFNNNNLIVRTSGNNLFCVNVQDPNNPTATNLNLVFNNHGYANATNELIENRPYFLVNTTNQGAYVITNDCTPKQVGVYNINKVFKANNVYAIVQDGGNNVFVVKADGSSELLLTTAAGVNVYGD
ncbi:MAG: hypothetical protein ACK4VK_05520, partial [Aquificaceae bacterium]